MPIYTIEQLNVLKTSDLVRSPEFLWNEIETVPAGSHFQESQNNWRRGSHNNTKRPVVMPKAAIPFSQRALFDNSKSSESAANENNDEGEADDDEYAARFLLKSKKKTGKKPTETEDDGAPVVNLSYAAALAASMKMSESADLEAAGTEEVPADGEDGWVSVTQAKPRRNRHKQGSFSKWKSS